MGRTKLYLLGRFRLERDSREVEISSRPARSLLALLALNPEKRIPRDKVAGELWPDSTEKNARTSLRQTLWQLRHDLAEGGLDPDDLIEAGRLDLTLVPGAEIWIDAVELEQHRGPSATWDERVQQARLYSGELLPGVYEEWASSYRARLAARADILIERLLDDLLGAKRWDHALGLANDWLALSGPTESAYRAVIIAHSGLGDAAAAMAAYQECVAALDRELGVPPSPETEELFQRLRAGERLGERADRESPQVESGHEPDPLKSLPTDGTVFVARQNELERLLSSFEEVRNGQGTVHFVRGESGRGKTALVQEFIQEAQSSSQAVAAVGTCEASVGMGDPFAPFREIMALLAGDLRANPGRGVINRENGRRLLETRPRLQSALHRYGPDLAPRFLRGSQAAIEVATGGSAGYTDSIVSQAVRCLLAVAETNPLILFVDDLQWADRGTLTIFFRLGRRLGNSPCMLIGAYRPEELELDDASGPHPLRQVVAELIRLHGARVLDLDEISDSEEREFLDRFLDSEPNRLDEEFRSALFKQTGGHPLFTIELLRTMESQGALVRDQHGSWSPGFPLKWGELPPRVEAALEARVSRLDRSDSEILEVAAVEGETFTAEVLGRVLNLPLQEVISTLSGPLQTAHRLVIAEGVRRLNGETSSSYRFRHQMIHSFMYEQVDPVERVHLHGAVADALEDLHHSSRDEIVIRLARHYRIAEKRAMAVKAYLAAGRLSGSLSAHQEAVEHLQRGLDLLRADPALRRDASLELELLLALGPALIAGRGYANSSVETVFQRARRLGREVGSDEEAFAARWGLWSFYTVRAKHRLARSMARAMRGIADRIEDRFLRLTALRSAGSTDFYLGRFRRASAALAEAASMIQFERGRGLTDLFGQDPEIDTLAYLSLTEWFLGDPLGARARMSQALELARSRRHPYSETFALTMQSTLSYLERDPTAASQAGAAAEMMARKRGYPFWLAASNVMSGWASAAAGDISGGIQGARAGVEGWQRTGAQLVLPTYLAILGELELAAGEERAALETLARGLALAQNAGEHVSLPTLLRLLGEAAIRQGEFDRAGQMLERAIRIASEQEAAIPRLRASLALAKLGIQVGGDLDWRDELQAARRALEGRGDLPELAEANEILELNG